MSSATAALTVSYSFTPSLSTVIGVMTISYGGVALFAAAGLRGAVWLFTSISLRPVGRTRNAQSSG